MTDPSCYTPPSIATLKELVDLFGRFMANDAETPASASLDSLQGVLKQRLNFIPYATSAELQGALAGIDAPQLVVDEQSSTLYAVVADGGANRLVQITSAVVTGAVTTGIAPLVNVFTLGDFQTDAPSAALQAYQIDAFSMDPITDAITFSAEGGLSMRLRGAEYGGALSVREAYLSNPQPGPVFEIVSGRRYAYYLPYTIRTNGACPVRKMDVSALLPGHSTAGMAWQSVSWENADETYGFDYLAVFDATANQTEFGFSRLIYVQRQRRADGQNVLAPDIDVTITCPHITLAEIPASHPLYDAPEAEVLAFLKLAGNFSGQSAGFAKVALKSAEAFTAQSALTAQSAGTAQSAQTAARQITGYEDTRFMVFGHSQVMQQSWASALREFVGFKGLSVWGGVGGTVQPKPNEAAAFEGFYSRSFIERAVDEALGSDAPDTGFNVNGLSYPGVWDEVSAVFLWAGINDALNLTGDPAASPLPLPGNAYASRPLTVQEQVDLDTFLAGGSPSTPVSLSAFILADGARLTYAHLYHTMIANLYRHLASSHSTGSAAEPVYAPDCLLYRPDIPLVHVRETDSYSGYTGQYRTGNDAENFYTKQKIQDEVARLWGLPCIDLRSTGINYLNKDWYYLREAASAVAHGDLEPGDPQLYVHFNKRGGRAVARVFAEFLEGRRARAGYAPTGSEDGVQPDPIDGLAGRSLAPWVGDRRLALDRASAAEALSLDLRSGAVPHGRLELTGTNNTALAVSADGAAFTPALEVDRATGVVSQPRAPVFCAYTPGPWTSITTTHTQLTFTTAVQNVGGHYDPATSRFTAPVDGVYGFLLNGFLGSVTDGRVTFAINDIPRTTQMQVLVGEVPLSFTVVLPLTAGDYVTCTTGNVNTILQYYRGHTMFSGWKIA